MSKSEDVTKLFAMFGEKNTDQYQEIHEAEQNRATRERWPVFQRVHVEADPQVPTPPAARSPLPRPFGPVSQAQTPATKSFPAPPPTRFETATAPASATATAPLIAPVPPTKTASVPLFRKDPVVQANAPTATEHRSQTATGDLRSLFQRIEGLRQPVAQPVAPPPAATPEPPAGSIRSLFSRLSR